MSLHTRSKKYGKLYGGELVAVPWVLMRRMKQHFHTLEGLEVDLLLASNVYVWIAPSRPGQDAFIYAWHVYLCMTCACMRKCE